MTTRSIYNYTFSDIVSNIKRMLNESALNPKVREFAVEISSGSDDKISAVYDWVKSNVMYTADPMDIELITSPIRLVNDYRDGKQLAEDCDGHALFVTALLRSVGVNAHVVILDVQGKGWDHAVAVAYSEKLGREIFVDTTSTKPLGWSEKYVNRYDIKE